VNRFRLAPAADADIDDLAEHVAKTQGLAAADRFIDAIYEKCELLALHADIGRLRPELAPRLRSFPAGPFVILYRPRGHDIEIVRIVRGARDIPALF
jgi:toxin ParE1/3/4